MSSDKIVLVTGAAGFVGSHLVEYFLSRGYSQVHGTTQKPDTWLTATLGDKAHVLDLTDPEAVDALVEVIRPDWIVHLAGIASVESSFQNAWPLLETNLKLQYVLLESVRKSIPQARFLSISSATIYGEAVASAGDLVPESLQPEPNNPYALSKWNQEILGLAYRRMYGLDVITVRPFNQVGPRQTGAFAIPAFAQQVVQVERGQKQSVEVGNLEAERDFTDVRDAAQAYELLLEHGVAGEIYNLGRGQGVKMQAVLDLLIQQSGKNIPVEIDPSRLRPVDVPRFVADNQKLRALGWKPHISLEQSLKDIMEYERNKENS